MYEVPNLANKNDSRCKLFTSEATYFEHDRFANWRCMRCRFMDMRFIVSILRFSVHSNGVLVISDVD